MKMGRVALALDVYVLAYLPKILSEGANLYLLRPIDNVTGDRIGTTDANLFSLWDVRQGGKTPTLRLVDVPSLHEATVLSS